MFSIGDFARHGRVSVRMLRHMHRGSMDGVLPTIQALARWIDAHGYRSAGYNRELYVECGDDGDAWVTELQEPIAAN